MQDDHVTCKKLSGFQSIGEERRIFATDELEHNPYLKLGLGVSGYFYFLKMLILVFTILSFFAVGQIYLYSS